jgi:uncharacterized protein YegL
MKLINDNDASLTSGVVGGFQFSAVRPETLGATEYTLVTLALDKTGSVIPFATDLFKVKKTVIDACLKSPRADYLLVRVLEFNTQVDEVHGFKPLSEIDPALYTTPTCGGMTALRDATFASVSATNAYAKTLGEQDYLVNGIVFVCTDGGDNQSRTNTADVQAEIKKGVASEYLESLRTILIGVNTQACAGLLQSFQQECGIEQYVDIAEATPQKLAKLAEFVSRSISAQSQSLGTGGPSQALTFC